MPDNMPMKRKSFGVTSANLH